MPVRKRILIIGPYGEVGGVRTHVEHLQSVLRPYGTEIKVTRGTPFSQMLRERLFFRPEVIIHNLSVYRNPIIRSFITRTIMTSRTTKHVLHLHGGRFCDVDLAQNPVWQLFLKLHFRQFDQIFCLTEEQYSAVSAYLGNSRNVRKISNYVDIPRSRAIKKEDDKLNFLYLGRLDPLKGIREAIEAIRRVKGDKIRLWIIGAGELETELAAINDPRIVFLGEKKGIEKNTYLAEAHVLLLPSWKESLPYALLEAAAYGLALIATPVGAIDQVLCDGKNGFFVKPGDVPMLAHTIEKLLADRSMVLKMGKESRRICEERFALENLQHIYDGLFREWYGGSATSKPNFSHAE